MSSATIAKIHNAYHNSLARCKVYHDLTNHSLEQEDGNDVINEL